MDGAAPPCSHAALKPARTPAWSALSQEIKGSKTEGAGLFFVENLGSAPQMIREAAFRAAAPAGTVDNAPRVLKQYAFSSDRKMMVRPASWCAA